MNKYSTHFLEEDMIKFIPDDTAVVLAEVPDEISLAINLSNCPHRCEGCHSAYLQQDIGEELTKDVVIDLIEKNAGISCVLFMGGDARPAELCWLVSELRKIYPDLKYAVYSGNPIIRPDYYVLFDYIKIGGYDKTLGGLDSETTNQKFFKLWWEESGEGKTKSKSRKIENQTYKFKKKW